MNGPLAWRWSALVLLIGAGWYAQVRWLLPPGETAAAARVIARGAILRADDLQPARPDLAGAVLLVAKQKGERMGPADTAPMPKPFVCLLMDDAKSLAGALDVGLRVDVWDGGDTPAAAGATVAAIMPAADGKRHVFLAPSRPGDIAALGRLKPEAALAATPLSPRSGADPALVTPAAE
jgi:hypothetical protein